MPRARRWLRNIHGMLTQNPCAWTSHDAEKAFLSLVKASDVLFDVSIVLVAALPLVWRPGPRRLPPHLRGRRGSRRWRRGHAHLLKNDLKHALHTDRDTAGEVQWRIKAVSSRQLEA